MKTSDVPPNRQVQSGGEKTQRADKKPQKEFDKVLEDHKGKQGASLKKEKPFSPLGSKPLPDKKGVSAEKKEAHTAQAEAKPEKEGVRTTEHRDYDRVEARGEKGDREGDLLKKEPSTSSELGVSQQLQGQNTQIQTQTNVQQVSDAKATQKSGLNIDEIQSIVRRVELSITDKGKPEFRFELETKNLGNIDLKVTTENEQVRIEFATQDVHAQDVIKENLKELSEMLQKKGLTLGETKFAQRGQEDAEKQQEQQQKQEQADDFSSVEGRPRRTFRL